MSNDLKRCIGFILSIVCVLVMMELMRSYPAPGQHCKWYQTACRKERNY